MHALFMQPEFDPYSYFVSSGMYDQVKNDYSLDFSNDRIQIFKHRGERE